MYQCFKIKEAVANQSGAMEADTISKHGRSSKSQMSRRNSKIGKTLIITLTVVASVFIFNACAGDDYTPSDGGSNNGGGGSSTTKLNTPTGVSASQSGSNIIVSWNSVMGATSYKVYHSTSASGSYSSLGEISDGTSAYVTNPPTGYNYFKLTAVNSAGESAQSSSVSVNFTSGTGGGGGGGGGGTITKPNAPTGVTATKGGPAMYPYVSVSWNSVSGATSYKIYRSTSANGSYSSIGTANSTSYTDNSPRTGDNYYKVSAVNSAGESAQSGYALCNTTPSYSPCPPTVSAIKSGSGAKITWSFSTASGCGTPTSVKVEWWYYNAANGYKSTAKTIHTSTQASGNTTTLDYTIGASVTNYYRVTGTNGAGSDGQTATLAGN